MAQDTKTHSKKVASSSIRPIAARKGPRWLLSVAAITIAVQAGVLGCRSEISVNGQGAVSEAKKADDEAPPASEVAPTASVSILPPSGNDENPPTNDLEIPAGLYVTRSYVQSRTPITLMVTPDLGSRGDTFSVYSDAAQALVTHQTMALYGPYQGRPGSVLALWPEPVPDTTDLSVTLDPLDPELTGKLAYGMNRLRLVVGEETLNPRHAECMLYRGDFGVAAVSRSYFPQGSQRQSGFEAELGLWHQPVVTTSKSTLTLGVIPLLSR